MTQMYGNTFLSSYGESPPETWRWALARVTDEEITRGLTGIAQSGTEFPPSLPKFLEYCNPPSPGVRFLGTPQRKALEEAPKADLPTVEKHLAKMRGYFK